MITPVIFLITFMIEFYKAPLHECCPWLHFGLQRINIDAEKVDHDMVQYSVLCVECSDNDSVDQQSVKILHMNSLSGLSPANGLGVNVKLRLKLYEVTPSIFSK